MQDLLQQRRKRRTITTSSQCGKRRFCCVDFSSTSIYEHVTLIVHMIVRNKLGCGFVKDDF